uniref:Adenosine deaminase n=1 Tax=Heliothis virescens TaxID=7102 RepID=A0A2A4K563_HELVI
MYKLTAYTIACLLITLDARSVPDNYNEERRALLDEETITAVGGKLTLNEDENKANDILMRWKMKELNESYINPQHFNFSKHYFSYKKDMEDSKVYQIITRMPKGAVLHVHSSLMLHPDVLVKLTYEDHLYACNTDDDLKLQFSETTPERPCQSKWTLVSDIRNSSGDPAAFDSQLKKYFTLYREDGEDYNFVDINTVWERFNKVYRVIKSLISYRPVREKYWYATLEQFYNDNIMYIEIRTGLHSLYELDGTKHEKKYLVNLFKNVTNKFIEDHPDFIGVKLIVTKHRALSINQVFDALNLTRALKVEMPDMIAGFDLVGQEDIGRPLTDFLPVLSEARNDINFYLHAGETAWLGTSADENLVDAILLGSKRIGHGYALTKHPSLMSAVIKNDIALEVNVISNVVLSLVHDVRNHPLASYLAMGLPVVLSSDDPGAWSAKPLTDDFFVAYMGIASQHADLKMLKQLALNSITYSALEDEGKDRLLKVFNKRWDAFVKDIISDKTFAEIDGQ